MCAGEEEEELLHELVEVGQKPGSQLGTKCLYGVEDLSETCLAVGHRWLVLLLLLKVLNGCVHELEQHWHQLTVVFTNLRLYKEEVDLMTLYHTRIQTMKGSWFFTPK